MQLTDHPDAAAQLGHTGDAEADGRLAASRRRNETDDDDSDESTRP